MQFVILGMLLCWLLACCILTMAAMRSTTPRAHARHRTTAINPYASPLVGEMAPSVVPIAAQSARHDGR